MKSYMRKEYKLPELFDMHMGKTPDRNNSEYWENGTNPWISIADMTSNGKLITHTKEYITDRAIRETGIKPINYNTVIMSFKLSVGKVSKVATKDCPAYSNEAIMAFEIPSVPLGSPMILNDYAYYLLQSIDFTNTGNKAFMGKTLNKAILQNTAVKIHVDLDVQSEIITVLDKITDLIDRRKEQLEKLDELVKARFVELFGTESEFDKWPCCTIGDVADVCVGVVIKPTQYYTDKGIPAFRSLNIGEMRVKDSDWVYFTEEGHQKNQKSVVHKNDVLVVRSGAPGTACVATEKYDGYNAVDIIIAHPDNNKVNSIFLAAFTNMPHGMNQICERTGGAAQQHFNVGGYKAMRLIMPSIELQNRFATFVEQTDKSKLAIQQSLDKLGTLKKSLMQKYFG